MGLVGLDTVDTIEENEAVYDYIKEHVEMCTGCTVAEHHHHSLSAPYLLTIEVALQLQTLLVFPKQNPLIKLSITPSAAKISWLI